MEKRLAALDISLCDVYRRFVRAEPGEGESMAVLYASAFLRGLIGTAVALAMIHIRSTLDTWRTLSGIFGGGVPVGFLLAAVMNRKKGSRVAR